MQSVRWVLCIIFFWHGLCAMHGLREDGCWLEIRDQAELCVHELIAAGADMQLVLYRAASCNGVLLRALLEKGAVDVNLPDHKGKTALWYAIRHLQHDNIGPLRAAGALVNENEYRLLVCDTASHSMGSVAQAEAYARKVLVLPSDFRTSEPIGEWAQYCMLSYD